MSRHVHAGYAVELLSARTDEVGYLLKEQVSGLAELAFSVQRAGAGGSVLDPAVVSQLVGRRRQAADPLEQLTRRERMCSRRCPRGVRQGDLRAAVRLRIHRGKHVGNIFTTLRVPPSAVDHRRVLAVVTCFGAQ